MPRIARVVVPGLPHHVTQRGNRRADVFVDEADRHRYLALLEKYAARDELDVWAYCLMTNHIHLVVVPHTKESLGRCLRDVHQAYASYFNRKSAEIGHLWQGRFFSCAMDESHAWAAVRYVELNPVRARMVAWAEQHPWSSAPAHCAGANPGLLSDDFPPRGLIADWSAWLARGLDDAAADSVRRHTRTGRPCGDSSFIARLEALLGRVLKRRRPGRKPRQPTDNRD